MGDRKTIPFYLIFVWCGIFEVKNCVEVGDRGINDTRRRPPTPNASVFIYPYAL